MPEELGKELLVESAKAVAVEGYNDTLKPTFKSIGNIIALPFQAIDVALAKPKLWVAEKQYNFEKTRELLAYKMKDVPEEKIVSPEGYVAVPALQQISYCFDSEELRDMYANLLASSMNIDTKYNVHPSFVDIIKQLTPDEAKLLKKLSHQNGYPLIDVVLTIKKGGYITLVHNFTDIAENVCDCPNEIFSYLDNFERLKLIEIPYGTYFKDEKLYKELEEHSFVKQLLNKPVKENEKIEIKKGKFELTAFGKNFIKVCL
ncbi:MAG: DUF4393 domain-containing protein [Clostridia bacterium]|nr:DUF4393 domain-containing protein [Clostridia bacterium]